VPPLFAGRDSPRAILGFSRDEATMALVDLLSSNNAPLNDEAALREHINRVLRVQPPRGLEEKLLYRMAKFWFRPQVFNAQRLPDRPCLFIGNHALFGLDGLVILPVLLEEYGRFLRPMGDKFLFSQSTVAKILLQRGGTMGHPEVARALMAHDQDILVFPGGAHEAVKPSRERYRLQWKDRLGFVRLAAEFGYTIVPFGLVGPGAAPGRHSPAPARCAGYAPAPAPGQLPQLWRTAGTPATDGPGTGEETPHGLA